MKPDAQKTTKAVREAPTASQCPRYVVRLTAEGWQVVDNVKGTFLADAYGSEEVAREVAYSSNRIDAAEGEGRR
jgi:hypothetical protein